ncbi:MAG: 4-(cytidine 5'-diphospho)-2-C-methyl-D-erythritol kinase [Solirubrobacterales bacterium]
MLLHAPAKLNLCLYLGPARGDGRHEIRSLFEPLSLADEIEVTESERDEVVCPQLGRDNLAGRALAALRRRGWDGPPLRIRITKRIPVAGGLGGGSTDAAAVLRLARDEVEGIEELAAEIGADVPSQLHPDLLLVGGAGEKLEPLPSPGEHAVVLLPSREGLSTTAVYAEADSLGLGRDAGELQTLEERLREAASGGASPLEYAHLLVNDLEPAAIALHPGIEPALESLRGAGAARALITGSGPTAFGLFADPESAQAAASGLGESAIVCTPGAP